MQVAQIQETIMQVQHNINLRNLNTVKISTKLKKKVVFYYFNFLGLQNILKHKYIFINHFNQTQMM